MTKKGLLLGVALMGLVIPHKADAYIEVCVSVTGRTFTLTLLPCQAGETLITWGDSGPPGPPGPVGPQGVPGPAPAPPPDPPPLGFGEYTCANNNGPNLVAPSQYVPFNVPGAPAAPPVGNNVLVPYNLTGQGVFTTWLLQPGVYRIDWQFVNQSQSPAGTSGPQIIPTLNGVAGAPAWYGGFIGNGTGPLPNGNYVVDYDSGLIQVTQPNSIFGFLQNPNGSPVSVSCQVLIEQLQ